MRTRRRSTFEYWARINPRTPRSWHSTGRSPNSRCWSMAKPPCSQPRALADLLPAFHPGPLPLIPADAKEAVPVRMLDRVFDSHVMTPMQAIVLDARRPKEARHPYGVSQARTALDQIYTWLDHVLAGRRWAA